MKFHKIIGRLGQEIVESTSRKVPEIFIKQLLHLVQRGGDWAGRSPPSFLLAVPNVTAHPSAASVPTTIFPLLCGFNNTNTNNNNNNNNHDNVYGAVIMAEPLREFTRFI